MSHPRLAPVRSISLPSRLRPASTDVHDDLSSLNYSISRPPAAAKADALTAAFAGLSRLYLKLEQLLQSPTKRQAISRLRCGGTIDNLLDGYVRLLDACNTAIDVLATTKDRASDLVSAIRRHGDAATVVALYADTYLSCRKKASKSIEKTLKSLKISSCSSSNNVEEEHQHPLGVVESASEVSAAVLCSLLEFLSASRTLGHARRCRCSPFTRAIFGMKVEPYDAWDKLMAADKTTRELLLHLRSGKGVDGELAAAQRQLAELERKMEELEEGVEGLFKRLIQSRVSILNILSS